MEENDIFGLQGEDLQYIQRTERQNIRFQDEHRKPMVFVHIERDPSSGRILELGAWVPEVNYSKKTISKVDGYTRVSEDGWSSIFLPVQPSSSLETSSAKYTVLKRANFEDSKYLVRNGSFFRCLEESEALTKFIQYLAPLKFCLESVTLFTFKEQDIKYLLSKISEFSLTQIFMSVTNDFLTLLHVLTTPEVPFSLEELVNQRSRTLSCLLDNSASKARALAHAFLANGQLFNWEMERKDFSVLEEFFHMNYTIKLDEGHESNTVLYIGDLVLNLKESDLRGALRDIAGITGDFTVKLCNHPKTRAFLGYAYLQFKTHERALKALSRLNNEFLLGKPMRVVWHDKHAVGAEKSQSNLFVKNIPPHIDQKQLNETFKVFGKVLSSKVAIDHQGVSRGFGFVQFDREEDSSRAILKMHGLYQESFISDLFVNVKLSDEERRSEKPSGSFKKKHPEVLVNVLGETLDLESAFQRLDQLGQIDLLKTNQARPSAVLAVFECLSGAEKAIQLDASYYLGNRWEVDYFQNTSMDFSTSSTNTARAVKIFVGNLDPLMQSEDLMRLFAKLPVFINLRPVLRSKVATNPNGESLLYGHVWMMTHLAPIAVNAYNGKVIGGKKLSVFIADEDDGPGLQSDEASTSIKGKTVPPTQSAEPAPVKEPPKIDPKSLLSNRIRNAVRKKLKEATSQSTTEPPVPSTSLPYPATSSLQMNLLPSPSGNYFAGAAANQSQASSGLFPSAHQSAAFGYNMGYHKAGVGNGGISSYPGFGGQESLQSSPFYLPPSYLYGAHGGPSGYPPAPSTGYTRSPSPLPPHFYPPPPPPPRSPLPPSRFNPPPPRYSPSPPPRHSASASRYNSSPPRRVVLSSRYTLPQSRYSPPSSRYSNSPSRYNYGRSRSRSRGRRSRSRSRRSRSRSRRSRSRSVSIGQWRKDWSPSPPSRRRPRSRDERDRR